MKRNQYILAAMAGLMASAPAAAQETYQDVKMAENDLTGSARYVGMGGAMEALGADISTISTNPAGVGLLRKSQVSLSFGVYAQSDAHNYTTFGGQRLDFDGKQSHPSFDQVGVVWSLSSPRSRSYFNLAFNYHKSTDFGQILNAANRLSNASQNKVTALANYLGSPAWTAVDANYGGYKDNHGNYVGGLLTVGNEGLLYETANSYLYGQYQKGYIGVYDFNISGSINNRVWLGLTVGYHDVNYRSNSSYLETLDDGNIANASDYQKIDGGGFDVKAGVIFRPVEASPFRLGFYVNSPVFYDLTLRATSRIAMKGNNEPGTFTESGLDENKQPIMVEKPTYEKGEKTQSVDYSYCLNTPWRVGASLGHTVGNFLALGATYEYAWYDHMDNRVKDGGYYDYWSGSYYNTSSSDEAMNAHTRNTLKGVSTLKLGVEYKPISMVALRLGYNYVSPMYEKNGTRDLSIGSNGTSAATSTAYTNWEATNRITAGVGFTYEKLFIDVAYQYSGQNGTFYPFMSYYENGVNGAAHPNDCDATGSKVSFKRHQLLMTVGYKF